jgi:hypothetical protein
MLARRTANPAVRTARARRDPTVSYVPGWAPAPDIGRALLTMLRTVAGLRDRAPRPWTEPSAQPVRSLPSAARLRSIRAASAHDARSRTSHNPLVVGSSPTRLTCSTPSGHIEQLPSGSWRAKVYAGTDRSPAGRSGSARHARPSGPRTIRPVPGEVKDPQARRGLARHALHGLAW